MSSSEHGTRPGLAVEVWPLERVTPFPGNPRRIPQRAIDAVAASLREFGWRQPIVVDEQGTVVVGHTRLLAARALGLEEVPVHIATGLTAAQVRAYRIADNRSGEYSAWDEAQLARELEMIIGASAEAPALAAALEVAIGYTGDGLRWPDIR